MKLAGIDIPNNKRVEIALTYVYGIGRSTSKRMLQELGIDLNIKAKDLSNEQVNQIRKYIGDNLKIEGDLRRNINSHISRLIVISCYRGVRHRDGLPVRGQKSRNKGGKRRDRRRKRASN